MASESPSIDLPLYKLVLVGDSGVGKSCLLLSFTDGTFAEDQPTTIGCDFRLKNLEIRDTTVRLSIWDTAGQERFRTLTSSYYRGAHGVVLVYDMTNRESFNNVASWLNEIDVYATNQNIVKMLVGNKLDRETDLDGRVVSREEGLEYARRHKMLFMECSARTAAGVDYAFNELAFKIMDTELAPADFSQSVSLGETEATNLKMGLEFLAWVGVALMGGCRLYRI